MTDHLEEQQRQVFVPSEEDFVARVREVEQERARTASRIDEQREAAEAKERDIERMRVSFVCVSFAAAYNMRAVCVHFS